MQTRPRALIQLEPEVFAVAMRADESPADQRAFPPRGRRALEHDAIARAPGAHDAPAGGDTLREGAGRFDLRQLGHRAVGDELLHDLEELHLEDERRAGLDGGRRAAVAVREAGRAHELAL